jgi:hypothetical protein
VSCPHYRAMQRLHDVLLQTIIDVTGKEAPWIYRSNSGPRPRFDQQPGISRDIVAAETQETRRSRTAAGSWFQGWCVRGNDPWMP